MAQQFVLQHRTGPRTFTVRDVRNAASTALYVEHSAQINRFKTLALNAKSVAEIDRAAAETVRVFFPTEERTQTTMRMILAGDHSGIEWFFDADVQMMVSALMAWGAAMEAAHAAEEPVLPSLVKKPARTKKPARAKKPIRKR